MTNTMDFGEKNENFSVNEDARLIIQKNNEKKEEYKRKGIVTLLDVLNKICKEKGLQYFAIGKLLTFWNEDADPYPDKSNYQIRMFRKDYDVMTDYLTSHASEHGLIVKPMYYDNKMVKYFTYTLSKEIHHEEKNEAFDFSINLNIIPLDEVPADEAERRSFYDELILKNRYLRGYSRDYAGMYKGVRSFGDKIKAKMTGTFHYNDRFFRRHYDDLRKTFTKYDGKNTGYVARLEMRIGRLEKTEDILPIRTVEFSGSSMMIPSNLKAFLLPNAENYANHLRSIRARALKKFSELCDKNDISYFAMDSLLIECMQDGVFDSSDTGNWKVGLLREDYDKVIDLLSDKKTADGLVLKCYQDEFITVPRREFGFISEQDDYPDVMEKNYQVLMEVFDYIPADGVKVPEATMKFDEMREKYVTLVQKERGEILPDADTTAMAQRQEMERIARGIGDKSSGMVVRYVSGYGGPKSVSEIFPLKKKDFRGFKLSVPDNEYLWFNKDAQRIDDSVNKERTELLKIFDRFCSDENIEYFAIADLLVGAVIYHDSIPNWTKTGCHMALVRDQYEKAISILREKQDELGIVLTEYVDNAKKYPCRIRYINFPGKQNSKKVVYLSPFDKLPESFYLRRSYREELREYNNTYKEIIDFGTGNIAKYQKIYTPEEIEQKIKEYSEIDIFELYHKIDTMAQKYNDDPQAYSYGRSAFSFSKIIDVEDLYPLRRIKFCDVDLLCPNDYSVWQPIQDENLLFQVKCIQDFDKKMMLEMDRVCKELGVGYFICGGTMLGYMRHKGFIPWDDDVDVAMLRADYEKFIKEAGPLFKEGYFLQTRESDPNIPYLFSKLRVDNTEYITEWNRYKKFHKGLCLDIFPFDYVPNNLKERMEFVERCRQISKEHNAIAAAQFGEIEEPFPPRNEDERERIAAVKADIEEVNKISLKDTQEQYNKLATMYNDKVEELNLKTVASFVPSYTFIDVNDLLPYQRGMFEDIETSVPKRPDIFLEMQYGDYMQLPPLHARVAHRLIRWSDGVHGADNVKKRDYNKKDC